jgi:hypothetical protein
MLLTMMAMTVQLAAAAEDPGIEIPDSALRDPYGFVLSHCSPLVRRSSESLEACEYRVGEALRVRLPGFRTRPPATMVASGANDPPTASTGTAFGGRCTTSQDGRTNADGSSSSGGMVICSNNRSGAGARVLERLLRPD